MSIVTDRNYRQLLTAAVAKTSRDTQDIIYKATPLTKILKDSRRIKTKRAGGPELRIPVEFATLDAQWFTGYDKLEITPKELLNSAVFNWSRVVSMFSLTGTELLFTGGDEERIDLMAFYIEAARKTIKEKWEAALVGDGTADGGRQMIGLGGAVPIIANTGTYGGIDRANVPEWRTTTYNATTDFPDIGTVWDSTTARPIIERIAGNRSRGENYPDLWMFDSNSWQAVSASMVAHQRIVNPERAGRLGYTALSYYTPAGEVELVAAVGIGNVMPTNTAFGIDTKSLAIYEFPGQAFVPFHGDGGMRPINQDAVAEGIVWSGQMVLENPISTVRLQTA